MISVPIIFEDEHIMVVNKPAGLVVVPGAAIPYEETLAGWVKDYLGDSVLSVGQKDRWGIVHRLDKDTSGVLVVAKTPLAYEDLKEQFREREVYKVYWALVWGEPVEEEFIIDAPIDRNPKNRMRFVVIANGKRSVTRFKRLKGDIRLEGVEGQFSLLECRPKTGRTHQIRVHLSALGHPIAADRLYSGRRKYRYTKKALERPFLHAKIIGFRMTGIQACRQFTAPLPEELQKVLDISEKDSKIPTNN